MEEKKMDQLVEEKKLDMEKVGVPVDENLQTTWGDQLANIVGMVRHSPEEKERWAKLIRDFTALYYMHAVQTWGNTKWRGVKVLKPPTDMWIYQELIEQIKPDLIIETGSWCGGSALFMRDVLDKAYPSGKIISIDIDHEKIVEELKHIPGLEFKLASSVDPETITYIKAHIASYKCERIMVILDSAHDENHVSKELELYAPFVTKDSILIVEDTNNHPGPKEAVESWSLRQKGFKKSLMCEKFMLTFCRDGFWERVE